MKTKRNKETKKESYVRTKKGRNEARREYAGSRNTIEKRKEGKR